MALKVKKFVMGEDGYEIHQENGEILKVGKLISKGTQDKDEPHLFHHVLKYSDGVEEMAVLSTETVCIPDCSYLM